MVYTITPRTRKTSIGGTPDPRKFQQVYFQALAQKAALAAGKMASVAVSTEKVALKLRRSFCHSVIDIVYFVVMYNGIGLTTPRGRPV